MSAFTEMEMFGEWLKRRRKQLDLTQDQLGDLAGCSGAAIRKFEAGLRKPSRQLAELLARALQIPDREWETFLQLARGLRHAALPPDTPHSLPARQAVLPAENLPAPLTSLVDRVNDITAVAALLNDPAVRWVTLIGPPGIGKTRLSIQTGRQVLPDYADGVWFIDLAPLAGADLVLPAISRALVGLDLPPAPGFEQIARALKDRQSLLILDNFEHLTEAAIVMADLLKGAPHLKVLATSRIPLFIYGEHEYRVPPLATPPHEAAQNAANLMSYESVQLFVARARQHQPGFTISPESAAALVDICATLEGIPLALELAAASLRRFSLAELDDLLHRLEGGSWLRQLETPARDLPARQRSLENVIAWSYSLLSRDQQAFFAKLGVFSGWFDAAAVRAICTPELQAADTAVPRLLEELSHHSLLERGNPGGVPCWRMLEILHEFACLQLDPARRAELEARRAQYLLSRMQRLDDEPDEKMKETFFQVHLHNLHAALAWAITEKHTELGFQLVGYLDDYWSSHGYFKELLVLLKELFALPDAAVPELRASRLQAAADLAWQQHDFETALAFTREAVELGRVYGLGGKYATHVNRLGRIYLERGRYREARQALEECLALARADPQSMTPGAPLAQLGELALFEGRLVEAKSALLEALGYLTESESIFQAMVTVDLAEIALAEKNSQQAYDWLGAAHAYARLPVRRTLVYLCAVAGYLVEMPGRSKDAAEGAAREGAGLCGALEALSARSGVILTPFYRDLIQQRNRAARRQLTEAEWQAQFAAGQAWSRDFALEQAKRALER